MKIWSEAESLDYIREHELWDEYETHGVDFFFPLSLFEIDGRIVGGVQGQENSKGYVIGYFFILEKGNGYGRMFADELKRRHAFIQGNSLRSSIQFWAKVGMNLFPTTKDYMPFCYKAGA